MRSMRVTRGQKDVLPLLSRRDIAALRKHPGLVAVSRNLVSACKRIISEVEAIPEYSSRKKRATAYRRIVELAQKALRNAGHWTPACAARSNRQVSGARPSCAGARP